MRQHRVLARIVDRECGRQPEVCHVQLGLVSQGPQRHEEVRDGAAAEAERGQDPLGLHGHAQERDDAGPPARHLPVCQRNEKAPPPSFLIMSVMCRYLIDKLALRAGGEKDTDEEADTVGCCNLRVEHVSTYSSRRAEEEEEMKMKR